MDVFITGSGWITPLGAGLDEVWDGILAGVPPPVKELPGPLAASLISPRRFLRSSSIRSPATPPPPLQQHLPLCRHRCPCSITRSRPRPRRPGGRCAIIFAVCDGGVIYTANSTIRSSARAPAAHSSFRRRFTTPPAATLPPCSGSMASPTPSWAMLPQASQPPARRRFTHLRQVDHCLIAERGGRLDSMRSLPEMAALLGCATS